MKLFILFGASFADFKIKMQLCSDDSQTGNIVKAAFGGPKGLDWNDESYLMTRVVQAKKGNLESG